MLKAWREAERESQVAVAMRIGIDPAKWARWERGDAIPRLPMAVLLERTVGIPVAAWTEQVGEKS